MSEEISIIESLEKEREVELMMKEDYLLLSQTRNIHRIPFVCAPFVDLCFATDRILSVKWSPLCPIPNNIPSTFNSIATNNNTHTTQIEYILYKRGGYIHYEKGMKVLVEEFSVTMQQILVDPDSSQENNSNNNFLQELLPATVIKNHRNGCIDVQFDCAEKKKEIQTVKRDQIFLLHPQNSKKTQQYTEWQTIYSGFDKSFNEYSLPVIPNHVLDLEKGKHTVTVEFKLQINFFFRTSDDLNSPSCSSFSSVYSPITSYTTIPSREYMKEKYPSNCNTMNDSLKNKLLINYHEEKLKERIRKSKNRVVQQVRNVGALFDLFDK